MQSCKNEFSTMHELNTALSAHPSGKVGFSESTLLYKSFSNVSDNRK